LRFIPNIIKQPILSFDKELQTEFDAWEMASDEALIDFEQELK